jgi:hypothetical protein
MKSNSTSKVLPRYGMADVVSPRGVTYNVTCHQWFTNGLSSILTLPTICIHRRSVSQVSLYASNGSDGRSSAVTPRLVLLVLSTCFSSWLSLLSQAASLPSHPG